MDDTRTPQVSSVLTNGVLRVWDARELPGAWRSLDVSETQGWELLSELAASCGRENRTFGRTLPVWERDTLYRQLDGSWLLLGHQYLGRPEDGPWCVPLTDQEAAQRLFLNGHRLPADLPPCLQPTSTDSTLCGLPATGETLGGPLDTYDFCEQFEMADDGVSLNVESALRFAGNVWIRVWQDWELARDEFAAMNLPREGNTETERHAWYDALLEELKRLRPSRRGRMRMTRQDAVGWFERWLFAWSVRWEPSDFDELPPENELPADLHESTLVSRTKGGLDKGAEIQDAAGLRAPSETAVPAQLPIRLSAIDRALLLLARNPNRSIRKIAREVGCDPSHLYRSDEVKRLVQASRTQPPPGTKRNGLAEAENDDYK
jgi:hypothetical protein